MLPEFALKLLTYLLLEKERFQNLFKNGPLEVILPLYRAFLPCFEMCL